MSVNKLLDSLKSPDFDVDYFAAQAEKSSASKGILAQLDLCSHIINEELGQAVKASNQMILTTANISQVCVGELLALREHLAPIRQSLEGMHAEEQARVATLKAKHAQLTKAMEVSRVIKKLAKLHMDAAKLRALFPTDNSVDASAPDLINKVSMVLGPIESLRMFDEYNEIDGVLLVADELKLIHRIIDALSTTKMLR